MSRPAPSDDPATRRVSRLARAVAAAVVAGAALAGCTVTVEGVPQAAPQTTTPEPTTAPPTPTRPNLSDLDGEAAVFAEWEANGWVPRPIRPVTDPDSGVSAGLFGTAERRPVENGTFYQSLDAPASTVNSFAVFPMLAGNVLDAERAASINAEAYNGQVVGTQPVSVRGYRALDARFVFIDPQGRPAVGLTRFVELPQHLVAIESIGAARDVRVLRQVQDILADKLSFQSV